MSLQDIGFSVYSLPDGITNGHSKGPAEQYLDCVLAVAEKIGDNLAIITDIAEVVAERTLAGGTLYIRDKEGGFASEGLGRAGGLMLLRGSAEDYSQPNTLLLGSSGSYRDYDVEQVEVAHEAGDLAVAFGSHQQHIVKGYKPFEGLPLLKEIADYSIDNFLPDNDSIVSIEGLDTKICPAAMVVNALNLWTFTAEFVSACLRRGKMPTMYQSVVCPGSRERNAEVGREIFHSDLNIEPIGGGELGKEYLDEMTKAISQIKETQMDSIREASSLAAKAVISGKKAYAALMGHMPPRVPGGHGDPGIFATQDFSDEDIQPGDFIALIEYVHAPKERLDNIKSKGARSVWVGVPMEDDLDCPGLDIFIDPFWRLGDAVVGIPGYDVKILPPSGVIESMIYWLLSGEAAKICVDKGVEFAL
ncbi:MAG: hypothetical protein ACE5PV_05450 [Candidatus Poribacteria bacterium]